VHARRVPVEERLLLLEFVAFFFPLCLPYIPITLRPLRRPFTLPVWVLDDPFLHARAVVFHEKPSFARLRRPSVLTGIGVFPLRWRPFCWQLLMSGDCFPPDGVALLQVAPDGSRALAQRLVAPLFLSDNTPLF